MFGCSTLPTIETQSQPQAPSSPSPTPEAADLSYILLIVGLLACITHITNMWVRGDT